jgi:hypothetical protein
MQENAVNPGNTGRPEMHFSGTRNSGAAPVARA